MTPDNQLRDQSNDHSYFCMMPNMLDDMLDPYQYRLYAHIKRVCGESGTCWQSTATMAEKCKMSTGKVSEVKNELHLMGLIVITYKRRPNGGSPYHLITVKDIWPNNLVHCMTAGSPGEQAGSQSETKKTPLEEDPKEGGATAPHAPADEWPTEPAETKPETPPPNPARERLERMRSKFGDDPVSVGAHCQKAQEAEGQWTVPRHRGLSPACAVIKEATGYSPSKAVRVVIDHTIPGDIESLERWFDTCQGWMLCGNKYNNYSGMLEWYASGRTGYDKPEGRKNGGPSTGRRQPEQVISHDMVVM